MSLIHALKRSTKQALVRSGLLDIVRWFKAPNSAVILRYHSIADDPKKQANIVDIAITHSTEVFRCQMRTLAEYFNPVTLEDIVSYRETGRSLPAKAVAVTFDDGFADNYNIAAPIMEDHGIRGAVYLTVDCVENGVLPWFCRLHYAFQTTRKQWADSLSQNTWDLSNTISKREARRFYFTKCASMCGSEQERIVSHVEKSLDVSLQGAENRPRMMTWDQARDLVRRGHIIGNHTTTHANVAELPQEQMKQEIQNADRALKEHLELDRLHFSYPHPYPCLEPHYTESSVKLTEILGCVTAVTTDYGVVTRRSDLLRLPRIVVPKDNLEFRWALEASRVRCAS